MVAKAEGVGESEGVWDGVEGCERDRRVVEVTESEPLVLGEREEVGVMEWEPLVLGEKVRELVMEGEALVLGECEGVVVGEGERVTALGVRVVLRLEMVGEREVE